MIWKRMIPALIGVVIALYYTKLVRDGVQWRSNRERVLRERNVLLEAEEMLARNAVYFEDRVREGVDAILKEGLAVYPKQGEGLGFRQKSDPKDFEEELAKWPSAIGSIGPAFGLPPRGVMESYEIHNSRQRIRVVKGSMTWHVMRPEDETWEVTTIHASPITSAPLSSEKLDAAYHVVDAGLYHIVENASDEIAMVVTWHEADPVETVHVQWNDTDAADAISPYWRQFDTAVR